MPKSALGWTPLHYSALYGHVEVTKALLDAIGNDTNNNPHVFEKDEFFTPLHFAADAGQEKIVSILLDRIIGEELYSL